MSLARFFEAIAPTLLGEEPASQSAARLGVDPKRLGVYERFCRAHRFAVIESVFPYCRDAVSPERWPVLVEAYFRRHPMTEVELNANGARWPEFLAEEAQARALPEWLPELADLEWWEWQTSIAPNETAAPDEGPLRFASCLELRPYGYELIEWIESGRTGAPARGQTVVVFWRDPELKVRRETASPLELLVLKSVASGERLDEPVLAGLGLSRDAVEETLRDHLDAGILLGRR